MARIIQSRDVYDLMQARELDRNETHFAYNALDSAVTLRVHEALAPKVAASPHATTSYRFVRAMQGPALDMMSRGIMVNQRVRQDETERYLAIRAKAQLLLDRLADAVWGPEHYTVKTKTVETFIPVGKRGQALSPRTRTVVSEALATRPRGLNSASPTQVLAFFNTALNCPVEHEIRKTPAGSIRTPTANDRALRKWANMRSKGPGINPRDRTVSALNFAAPFVSLITTIREADKMLGVLKARMDADGRMRCSYNVVGTENGRWSSSANAFGGGTNLQNITPTMRRMFCADDGWRLISTDLEQAESRLVAAAVWQALGDDTYWLACESGDLHTEVCRMSWPELPWNGDAQHDRAIANQDCPWYKNVSYRDIAKNIGHGSNFGGSPNGIAEKTGIPSDIVARFQPIYFKAFPAIRLWQQWVKNELFTTQMLDTPLGRRRWFFGRPNDNHTINEAYNFVPQSTIGELLNLAMYNVWQRSLLPQSDLNHLPIQLLLQNHDAFLFQTPLHTPLAPLLAAVKDELEIPIPILRGDEVRSLIIPGEFVTGWNWAYQDALASSPGTCKFSDGNPDGLAKWRGSDNRIRQQCARATSADWLSRPLNSQW